MTDLADEFKKLYFEKYEAYLKKNILKDELEQIKQKREIAKACANSKSTKTTLYPIILGNAVFRVSVTNLGTFPPFKVNENYIYPIGFSSKKRFKVHNKYNKGSKDKLLYISTIEETGPRITSEDKIIWEGENFFEKFSEDVGGTDEIMTFEEFSGLSHPSLTKMIEEIGDISKFKNYIPIDQRQSSK